MVHKESHLWKMTLPKKEKGYVYNLMGEAGGFENSQALSVIDEHIERAEMQIYELKEDISLMKRLRSDIDGA
jgi:hypothetical protein|tara:strand:- start:2341 stop:2556 length:216 start_codon:yes stop_codon:yes gene_type:complete